MRSVILNDTQSRALVILPVISGFWLAIGIGLIGVLTPNYSHIDQFMSALGAVGAPFATWTNYVIFIPTEIWLLTFLVVLNRRFRNGGAKRLSIFLLFSYAVLLILIALLPCDAGCQIKCSDDNVTTTAVHVAHMVVAAVAYPLALFGLLFISLAAQPGSFLRSFALPAAFMGFCLFFAIVLMPELQGLFQRLLEAWIYLQFILLGFYSASIEPSA